FNRIPAKWLCDYGEEPEDRHMPPRIGKYPWGPLFSLVFAASMCKAVFMASWQYAAAALPAMWALLLIGISDRKYRIIPDQFVMVLAVSGIGFAAARSQGAAPLGVAALPGMAPAGYSFLSPLLGLMIGAGILLLIGIAGKLTVKKDIMGLGDVKLAGACGLISDPYGIIVILALSALSSAIVFAAGMLMGKIKAGDEEALGPFIAGSAAVYLIFSQEIAQII
ncbi:MAG: A24 family peptidase, partial [Clostridiales Family XIII bacterium]|nr:A24 family peptidase [Clostridiales Family XIII bacterium]